jgi:uncharacterized protein YjiS (DUF1127 family)
MNRTVACTAGIDVKSRRSFGLVALVEIVLAWQERARQRRLLALMDDRLLRDIGISRAEIAREAEKPFWRS